MTLGELDAWVKAHPLYDLRLRASPTGLVIATLYEQKQGAHQACRVMKSLDELSPALLAMSDELEATSTGALALKACVAIDAGRMRDASLIIRTLTALEVNPSTLITYLTRERIQQVMTWENENA